MHMTGDQQYFIDFSTKIIHFAHVCVRCRKAAELRTRAVNVIAFEHWRKTNVYKGKKQ